MNPGVAAASRQQWQRQGDSRDKSSSDAHLIVYRQRSEGMR
jgi:hypothetical protein